MPTRKRKEGTMEEARQLIQAAYDKAQHQLLRSESEYGFGLVDGLFVALAIIHEIQQENE
jgi:hypothetical protein